MKTFWAKRLQWQRSQNNFASMTFARFELGYINDGGSVGLFPIDADGKANDAGLVIVPQVDLTSQYRLIPAHKDPRLSRSAAFPAPFRMEDNMPWSAMATIGVNEAMCAENKYPKESIYLQEHPTQKVVVREKKMVNAGQLVAVAWPHQ